MRAFRSDILLMSLAFAVSASCAPARGQASRVTSASAAKSISSALQPFVGTEIAGAATLVATKDKVLEQSAVGMSALESKRPMRPDDLFWIASMSKPLSAVAIGLLHDEGKLDFDDPVAKFIPDFAAIRQLDGRPLTIRQLLTHTGGLGEQMKRDPHLSLAETGAMAARIPLSYPVGARWSYSTLGIDVVSRVIEVASGQPLDRFMNERLFKPLGLIDTTFWVAAKDVSRLAHSYRRVSAGPLVPAGIPYLYGTEPTDRERPPMLGAGLFSTASDIVRVYQMMLNGGVWRGRRILDAATVAELTRPQPGTQNARPGMAWGLGFSVIEDPNALAANAVLLPGSFGHGGAYGTNIWADPTRGLIYVLMIQRASLPNPDNSDMRIAFQKAAAKVFWRSLGKRGT